MRKNPSSVAHGSAASLATKTLAVTVANAKAVTPTVQAQQAATTRAYLFNWLAAGLAVAAKTHRRLSPKCSATAKRYATATAASRGITQIKSQMRLKSNSATTPPTTQNRNNFFAPDNTVRRFSSSFERLLEGAKLQFATQRQAEV
jgi:hypothetical protein